MRRMVLERLRVNPGNIRVGALVRVVFFPAGYFDRTEMVGVVLEKRSHAFKFVGFFQPDGPDDKVNKESQTGWFRWEYLVPMHEEENAVRPTVFIEILVE